MTKCPYCKKGEIVVDDEGATLYCSREEECGTIWEFAGKYGEECNCIDCEKHYECESIEEGCDNRPTLEILGTDGNAFALLGKAKTVADKNKMDWKKIKEEAMSGDYDNLLRTLGKYFRIR